MSGSFVLGAVFSIFLYCLLNRTPGTSGRTYTSVARFLSNISYTLYLVHVPFLVFCAAMIVGTGQRLQPNASALLTCGALWILVLAYASLVWALFERRTEHLRVWVLRVGGQAGAATAPAAPTEKPREDSERDAPKGTPY